MHLRTPVLLAAVLLLALAAGAPSPARALDPSQLCNVSEIGVFAGDPVGDIGTTYVTAKSALACLNAITLPYELAHQQVVSLAAFYEEFYVFNDIAANPVDTPHSELLSIPGMHTYNVKADIQAGFKALAASFPKGQPVSLAKVVFGINSIMLPVRDAGHTDVGNRGAYNGVLGDGVTWFSKLSLINYDRGTVAKVLIKVTGVHSKAVVTDVNSKRVIQSIGGKTPLSWMRDMANGPISAGDFKSYGVRMNNLIQKLQTADNWATMAQVASLEAFTKSQWPVIYTDGTNSSWIPFISLKTSLYSSLSIPQLSALASKPANPYIALQNALNHSQYTPITPAAAAPEPVPDRRSLVAHADADVPIPDNLIVSGGNAVGNFYITTDDEGVKFAVWKLTTFAGVVVKDYAPAWNKFVGWAKGNGTDRLIYDVTSNGGGNLMTGAYATASLFPELLSPSNTYPWLNANDRRVGPAAKYLVDNNLLLDGLVPNLNSFTHDPVAMAARVAKLNAAGSTELATLIGITQTILESVNILIANNTQASSCRAAFGSCSNLWNNEYPTLVANLAALPKTNISVAIVNGTLADMLSLLIVFAPFSDYVATSMDGKNTSYLYTNATDVKQKRGNVLGDYTQRYYVTTLNAFSNQTEVPPPPSHPFKQILAVTDGGCGSTCDTFTRSAWFYSFNNRSATSFKYFAYGGSGYQSDMTATSFQGGNKAGTDLLSQSWAYYGIAYVTAMWTGDETAIKKVLDIGANLPDIPPYTGLSGLPGYTQSEMYQTTLGPNALPMEYNLIPPDLYSKQWFSSIGGPLQGNAWKGGADLPALYKLAAKRFDD